jgi:hypothetical protein
MNPQQAEELAFRYAPVFAQKITDEWALADQIAPVDLTGSFAEVAKNPEHLEKLENEGVKELDTVVYYGVCETSTHYFLTYAVYHVLDWWKRYPVKTLYDLIRDRLDEHVHDLEGALLVVTKKPAGLVDAVLTVAHNNFYLYTEPRIPSSVGRSRPAHTQKSLRVVKFNETVDGSIWLDHDTRRVKLYIESKGHGMRGDQKGWGGGDRVWYYNPEKEKKQAGTIDNQARRASSTKPYRLESLFEAGGLWDQRFHPRVFKQNKDGRWGLVCYKDPKRKNEYIGGSANPPWSWNDHNDTSPIGELVTDPAHFIIRYAQGWGPVSTHYICNPFQGIGT